MGLSETKAPGFDLKYITHGTWGVLIQDPSTTMWKGDPTVTNGAVRFGTPILLWTKVIILASTSWVGESTIIAASDFPRCRVVDAWVYPRVKPGGTSTFVAGLKWTRNKIPIIDPFIELDITAVDVNTPTRLTSLNENAGWSGNIGTVQTELSCRVEDNGAAPSGAGTVDFCVMVVPVVGVSGLDQ